MSTSKYISCLNNIESAVSEMSHEDLEAFAAETQETLEALRGELKTRRAKKNAW